MSLKQLTAHFWLHEFCSSQTAERMGRQIVPDDEQLENITRLCVEVLEPIRAGLRMPMVITSGLRPTWLNTAIGGAANSAHLSGRAADVKVVGLTPAMFTRWIYQRAADEGWPIDQCILEFPPNGWTHIAIADKPRHQFLTARNEAGRTVYMAGIVA